MPGRGFQAWRVSCDMGNPIRGKVIPLKLWRVSCDMAIPNQEKGYTVETLESIM
jgi:hypothetical protein